MKYYNDDGTELNPDLLPTPDLCATCSKADDPSQEMACNLSRADQHGEDVFVCFGYQPNSPNIDRKTVLRRLCQQAEVACTKEDLIEPLEDDADEIQF